MPARPVEADRAAEVVDDQPGPLDPERIEESLQDPLVKGKAVGRVQGLVGAAEARQVERDRAIAVAERAEHLAVEVGGGGPAVQEQHRVALAPLEVVEPQTLDLDELAGCFGGHGAQRPSRAIATA